MVWYIPHQHLKLLDACCWILFPLSMCVYRLVFWFWMCLYIIYLMLLCTNYNFYPNRWHGNPSFLHDLSTLYWKCFVFAILMKIDTNVSLSLYLSFHHIQVHTIMYASGFFKFFSIAWNRFFCYYFFATWFCILKVISNLFWFLCTSVALDVVAFELVDSLALVSIKVSEMNLISCFKT